MSSGGAKKKKRKARLSRLTVVSVAEGGKYKKQPDYGLACYVGRG